MLDLPKMKPHRIITLCILLLAVASLLSPALSQQDILEERDMPQVRPQISCPPLDQPLPAVIEAPSFQGAGSLVRATGGIKFSRGRIRIIADDATYDANTTIGTMNHVTFTTCDNLRPDYRIVAKEVTLLPGRFRARHVALYLGGIRVITLPNLRFKMGGNGGSAKIFPTPGFDNQDGVTLSQTLRFADASRFRAAADLRLTTNSGIQGEVQGVYGIDGGLMDLPGRTFSYESLRGNALKMPQEIAVAPCSSEVLRQLDAARLYGIGVFSLKQRVYDVMDQGLIVYRQPEFAMKYVAEGLNFTKTKLDPRLEIYPEVTASWGRFKEVPGPNGFIQRENVSALLALNVLPLGRNTAVQPVFFHNWANYQNGDFYQSNSWAIDASHITKNGGIVSARYIKRNDSGVTPFQFDNVDILKEYQAGFQMRINKYVVGLVTSYNADNNQFYEWEALYGYTTDCLASWVLYNSRIQRVSFHVALINL